MSLATRKNKSHVWVNFEKLQSGKARCKLCSKELVSVGGSKSGMNAPLRAMHPDVGKVESAQLKLPLFIIGVLRQCPECRQETLTNMLLGIMMENLLPTTFIESSLVLAFLKFVEPDYKPPCRQTETHRLLSKKDALVARIKVHMKSSAADISITTDIYTSVTNEGYMSFTATYLTPEWQVMNIVLDSIVIHERYTLKHISVKLGEIA